MADDGTGHTIDLYEEVNRLNSGREDGNGIGITSQINLVKIIKNRNLILLAV